MRTLTSLSEAPGDVSMLKVAIDTRLGKNSSEFNSKLWKLNMRKLMRSDVDFYSSAKLGVGAYRVPTDSDYQLLGYLKIHRGHCKPGELTVVLGSAGYGKKCRKLQIGKIGLSLAPLTVKAITSRLKFRFMENRQPFRLVSSITVHYHRCLNK